MRQGAKKRDDELMTSGLQCAKKCDAVRGAPSSGPRRASPPPLAVQAPRACSAPGNAMQFGTASTGLRRPLLPFIFFAFSDFTWAQHFSLLWASVRCGWMSSPPTSVLAFRWHEARGQTCSPVAPASSFRCSPP